MKNKYVTNTPNVLGLLNYFKDFYNPDKHIIKLEEVDWYDFEKRGVNLELILEKEMDCLLSGCLTDLFCIKTECIAKDTFTERYAKLRLFKDEHGKVTNFIFPLLRERKVPDMIFNYRLSEWQKKELKEDGRLERSISVVIEKSKKLILPYFDKETNQLMYRCMDFVKVPNEYKGKKLDIEKVRNLIYGKKVPVEYEEGKIDVLYIDPVDGKIKTEFVWEDFDDVNVTIEKESMIGDSVMVSPRVTHYGFWEKGTIIEVEDNSFNGIVLTVEMPNGDVFFERDEPEYFKREVMPYFAKPGEIEKECELISYYNCHITKAIHDVSTTIATMIENYGKSINSGESECFSIEHYKKTLLSKKECLKELLISEKYVHGETQYDLGKQALLVMKNKIIKFLYKMETDFQDEYRLLKFKNDGTSFVKGMDFVEPEIYIPCIFCEDFSVEYTMYLGKTEEGKEILCTLILQLTKSEDFYPTIYTLDGGLLLCGDKIKYLEPNITLETLRSYLVEFIPVENKVYELPFSYEYPAFDKLGYEVRSVMSEAYEMICDKKFQMFNPMPLVKLQSLMKDTYAQAKYVNKPFDDEYNDIIKECKRKEKLALKKRYKELYSLLHETMVDPYDYVDLMVEYAQVGRKLKQLEQC